MAGRSNKKLRSGFTTGTAATAAAKAALIQLLTGRAPDGVAVTLLNDRQIHIPVRACRPLDGMSAQCSVIKDGGDDPDITHGAEIGARVHIRQPADAIAVEITGGPGVGRVTKPGLEVAQGQAAINPGPMKMMRMAVAQVCTRHGVKAHVGIEVFVPQGESLARRTLNGRLGIVGGISILGTTGVVRPLSHQAYIQTVAAALSVARAAGLELVVLTTGRRSERFAQANWPGLAAEGFVQIGDYFADSLKMAVEKGFRAIIIAVFFGKAVKMAQGMAHTHARSARLTLAHLARWALEFSGDRDFARQVREANTARHAFDFIKTACPALIDRVAREIVRAAENFTGGKVAIQVVILDFDGEMICRQGAL